MLRGNQRLRVLILLVVVQIACFMVGLWVHHGLVVSSVNRVMEETASTALAEDAHRWLTAAGEVELPKPTEDEDDENERAIRRLLETQPAPPEASWILTDSQWQVRAAEKTRPNGTHSGPSPRDRLPWSRLSQTGDSGRQEFTGTLLIDGLRHAAVARRLPADEGYLVVHRPLERVAIEPGAVVGVLATTPWIAWVWFSPLLVIVVYLIVTRVYDELEKERKQAEAVSLQRIQSLARTRDAVIYGLASLAESRDEVTGRHVERVSFYASQLAKTASRHSKFREAVNSEFIQHIAIASVLHDIGKVGIEDAILFKPGPLDDWERKRMQEHSRIGGRYLAEIEQRLGCSKVIRMAREIAVHHHEHWDGTGYPDGLSGEAIPLSARIAAIADVYEALTSLRDYKPPFSQRRCVEIICQGAGTQFDPDLVEVFLKLQGVFGRFARAHDIVDCRDDEEVRQSRNKEELICMGLVSTMKQLDEEWTVPTMPIRVR